jgi:hypothetical protein
VLADFLENGFLQSGSKVRVENAKEYLILPARAESDLISFAVPPVTAPWGPFSLLTYRRGASSRIGAIVSDRMPLECSPLSIAAPATDGAADPIHLLNPNGDEALAAYAASLPGPVWVEGSDFGPPSPLRDPARLVSETFYEMAAARGPDGLFSTGEDDKRLADDVSAAFWQSMAAPDGKTIPSLADDLLDAWASERQQRHDVLTADLSTEIAAWTPAGPPDLLGAIHSDRPARTPGFR